MRVSQSGGPHGRAPDIGSAGRGNRILSRHAGPRSPARPSRHASAARRLNLCGALGVKQPVFSRGSRARNSCMCHCPAYWSYWARAPQAPIPAPPFGVRGPQPPSIGGCVPQAPNIRATPGTFRAATCRTANAASIRGRPTELAGRSGMLKSEEYQHIVIIRMHIVSIKLVGLMALASWIQHWPAG